MASFSSRLRQIILLVVLIALGFLLVKELYIFLPGFLGAVTLYILSRGWYRYLTINRKWNKNATATLFMFGFLIMIGFPVYYIISLLSPKVTEVFKHSDEVLLGLKSVSAQIKEWTGQELFTDANVAELQKRIANFFPAFLNSTAMILSNLAMMLFVYFFMLTNGKAMEASFDYFLPLHEKNIDILGKETISVVRANAIGIPLISFIQGVFAMIGYWIFGIKEPVLWGFITGVFAFFPIVGTTLIWAPLVVYLFSLGNTGQGIGLLIYSLLITGNVDYLARITLMKRLGDVHPMVTVLGVIVGLSLFGFWGFIFGPLLISYFMLLFKIYTNEFGPMHATDNVHEHGS
ncbi:putative PurR-regulated permease PerM [Lacibacter cauensis]|uniref:Putative PurR-regulated permease PerM n=1 Tax=Lacibacter cauensis TaxID=510947 RepID=A0A562SM44_9BACT|nr:AI-2E family transporter [Lacibacter cauensis]TWI81726.1 putative PurR-regulated permease PerM [Lacibacter cauensis]